MIEMPKDKLGIGRSAASWWLARARALGGGGVPGPASRVASGPSSVITHGLRFTGASTTGQGGRMDTTADYGGATELTVSFFARLDTYRASFGVGQWLVDNVWIVAPSDTATYGPGSDGARFWAQAGLPTFGQWGSTLNNGAVIHVVARFEGAGSNDAERLRMWAAAYESGSEVVAWAEQTPTYGPTAIPASLPAGASRPPVQVGGATYGTAVDVDGLIGSVAIWDTALDPVDILTMHDSSTRQPTDLTVLDPTNLWQPTAADIGQAGLSDLGSAGDDGTFAEGTDGGIPTVEAWSE